MASAVCQGLQSCLEPPLTESTVLTHKSSSKPSQQHQKPNTEANSVIEYDNNGERVSKNNGFSFFNVLENPSSNSSVKNEEVYVHPMVKRSASTLSTMSLEMCTESLGTETGSDVSESSDESFNLEERERFRSKARNFHRKVASRSHRGGFPPPLTSISGSDGTVKVSPHREGGRLVIKAVSVSECGTKFEAERTDGRLRLSLLKDSCGENVETRRANKKNEGGEEESCDGDVEGGRWWWEVDGRNSNSKRPTRVVANSFEDSTEFSRLRSCKDGENGNKGIGNWSLFRPVVIS